MKFKGMLFCTDLDGTLFNSNRQLSEQNSKAIEYFKSEGGLFTFITGRVRLTADEIYRRLKPNAPFACFNGAALYDGVSQSFKWWIKLDSDFKYIVEDVKKNFPDAGCHLNTKDNIYFTSFEPSVIPLIEKFNISRHINVVVCT